MQLRARLSGGNSNLHFVTTAPKAWSLIVDRWSLFKGSFLSLRVKLGGSCRKQVIKLHWISPENTRYQWVLTNLGRFKQQKICCYLEQPIWNWFSGTQRYLIIPGTHSVLWAGLIVVKLSSLLKQLKQHLVCDRSFPRMVTVVTPSTFRTRSPPQSSSPIPSTFNTS